MANPTVRDVHIDSAMAGISIAYRNGAYIGEQVFPRLTVNHKSDYYYTFPKQAWFRDDVALRAPGTRAQRGDYSISSASYSCQPYAIAKVVADEVRMNADMPLNPDIEATEWVTDALIRAQERRVAALVTGSTLWAYAASPTTQWSTDTSDPLGDIDDAVDAVVKAIGRLPNTMVVPWPVWKELKNHPDLLERIKYTRPGAKAELTDLSAWFNMDKVLLGTAIYDPAQEGATGSNTFIWGKYLWVGYVPNTPSLMAPAAGYVLEWQTRQVRRYREDQEHADVIEASHNVTEVISASDAGAVIYKAVA